jgi:hypothetical protein
MQRPVQPVKLGHCACSVQPVGTGNGTSEQIFRLSVSDGVGLFVGKGFEVSVGVGDHINSSKSMASEAS